MKLDLAFVITLHTLDSFAFLKQYTLKLFRIAYFSFIFKCCHRCSSKLKKQ